MFARRGPDVVGKVGLWDSFRHGKIVPELNENKDGMYIDKVADSFYFLLCIHSASG